MSGEMDQRKKVVETSYVSTELDLDGRPSLHTLMPPLVPRERSSSMYDNQDCIFTYEKLGALKLEHNDNLSQEWKDEFIQQWEELRKSIWEFDLMCKYQIGAQLWYWCSIAIIFSLCENQNNWYTFIGIFVGFSLSQFMFVFSHMIAHAEFLYAYPTVKIWQQKTWHLTHGYVESKSVVKYWAFYHHHANVKNDWFPFLSSWVGEHSLTTQIIHLHTFTLLFQPYKWIWCVGYAWWSPGIIAWLIFGFNLSAFYLWCGHDWSHTKALEDSCLFGFPIKCIMTFFSMVGINAAREDHFAHHIHNHKYVYTDFSIGETLFPWFMDHYFNKIWNSAFERATLPDGRQSITFLGYLGDAGNYHNLAAIVLYFFVVMNIQILTTPVFNIWATLYILFDVIFFLITFLLVLTVGEYARDRLTWCCGTEDKKED